MKNRSRRFKILIPLLILVSLMSLILNLSPVSASPATEPYKIGALFSTTGSQSNLGVPQQNTVEMLVSKINAAGGINGHPLEVIIYNDESDATKSATLANKLIEEDQVLAIIGPTATGSSMAIIDAVTTAEIPLVSCGAGASIVTPVADRYWVFKTPQTDKQVVTEIYIYLQRIGITKVAIITSTFGFGQGGKTYLESEASKYGITLVDNQTFGSDDTSMISQLTHIKGTDAQAVVCWDTDKASAVVAKDMQTLQFDIPLFCSHGIANQAFIDAAGDAANGVIFPAGKLLVVDDIPATDPQKEVLTDYRDKYEALYGENTVSTFGGYAYDALYMVVGALENMDEGLSRAESRAAIRDNLEQITNFTGISGVFTMSPTDHLGMQPGSLALIEIVDGGWTVVNTFTTPTSTPASTATAQPSPTPVPTTTSTPTPTSSILLSSPQLITPEVGATISDDTPLFTWAGVAGSSNYRIQISTDSGFGANSLLTDTILGNVQAYEVTTRLADSTYYWHVKAANDDSESPWSSIGSFTISTSAEQKAFPLWIIGAIGGGVVLIVIILVIRWNNKRMATVGATDLRIKQLKKQMEKWRAEGYDVTSLEDLFK